MNDVGQTFAWIEWAGWPYKSLAWVNKMRACIPLCGDSVAFSKLSFDTLIKESVETIFQPRA